MRSDAERLGVHQRLGICEVMDAVAPYTHAPPQLLNTGWCIENLSLAFGIFCILSKFVKCTNVESMAIQGRQCPVIA